MRYIRIREYDEYAYSYSQIYSNIIFEYEYLYIENKLDSIKA